MNTVNARFIDTLKESTRTCGSLVTTENYKRANRNDGVSELLDVLISEVSIAPASETTSVVLTYDRIVVCVLSLLSELNLLQSANDNTFATAANAVATTNATENNAIENDANEKNIVVANLEKAKKNTERKRIVLDRLRTFFARVDRNKYVLYDGTLASMDLYEIFDILCAHGTLNQQPNTVKQLGREMTATVQSASMANENERTEIIDAIVPSRGVVGALDRDSLMSRFADAQRVRTYAERIEPLVELIFSRQT